METRILAVELVRLYYGDVVASVFDTLSISGQLTVKALMDRSNLPFVTIRNVLLTLLTHNLACFRETGPSSRVQTQYSVSEDAASNLLICPNIIRYVSEKLGEPCGTVVESVLASGQMTRAAVGALHGEEGMAAFDTLLAERYFERCPLPSEIPDPSKNVKPKSRTRKRKAEDDDDDDLRPAKRARGDSGARAVILTDEEKDTVTFRIHFPHLHLLLQYQMCYDFVTEMFGEAAGTIVNLILQRGEIDADRMTPHSQSANINDVFQSLPPHLGLTMDRTRSIINDLGTKLAPYLTRDIDMVSVDLEKLVAHNKLRVLESIIDRKYDTKCTRLFRIIVDKKQIEQKQIIELAMMNAKVVRERLNKLLTADFVTLTEVARTHDMNTQKSIFLYSVQLPVVYNLLLVTMTKTARNLLMRKHHETSQHKSLLEVAEGGEVELLTDSERVVLTRAEGALQKLDVALHRIVDTIIILSS